MPAAPGREALHEERAQDPRASTKVRRLVSPKSRRRSKLGTSVTCRRAAATRQLSTASISKPSPHSMRPGSGPRAAGAGRRSSGRMSRQNAL
ncbi:hypothetical protein BJF78_29355 [Pseudonocardia sp. CNS-139]|nr:hypothetical protein BJF78_29355 [Pseudonocardia sp. CNS-139]